MTRSPVVVNLGCLCSVVFVIAFIAAIAMAEGAMP